MNSDTPVFKPTPTGEEFGDTPTKKSAGPLKTGERPYIGSWDKEILTTTSKSDIKTPEKSVVSDNRLSIESLDDETLRMLKKKTKK